MRKRLLRSRSGFEKPESREEAIMQNILGASNVLEPSESNIEEILKSILYNTPYTKEAEFEIEKILLAIKNNGTYDGECESRDLKILFAILNNLDYTEEAESRIEELLIEWLNQRSKVKVLEGIPPLTFVAKGEPLINYEISGNTVQNGTPTPDNPIMPNGTGDKTANLFDKTTITTGAFAILTGTRESDAYYCSDFIPITATSYYFQNVVGRANQNAIVVYDANKQGLRYITIQGSSVVSGAVTFEEGDAYLRINCFNTTDVNTVMVNLGSTALPYEPYGYKIPISSANTTTPVYLGEVETTRKVKKLVLDGTESWTYESQYSRFVLIRTDAYYSGAVRTTPCNCSHYQPIYDGRTIDNVPNESIYITSSSGRTAFNINSTDFTSVTDFKAYLAAQYASGTPVTVWYVLATEETGIVNEPLMRIGDYADTVSKEQAGVEIPTASGSNTLDVDTTVKPSNIYIEYK